MRARLMLALLEDHERDGMRVRVVACDCDEPCDTRFILGQYGHGQLWLASGIAEAAAVDEQVGWLLADEPENGMLPSEVIEHGIAMFGLTWPTLTASRRAVLAQLVAFDRAPSWMTRVPVERVWSCRGWCFGRDLSRVPSALWALRRAYVEEGPAVELWRS